MVGICIAVALLSFLVGVVVGSLILDKMITKRLLARNVVYYKPKKNSEIQLLWTDDDTPARL